MGLALLDPLDTTYLHGLGEPIDLPGRRERLRARHRRRPAEWTRNKFSQGDLCYELGCHAQDCLSRRGIQDESEEDGHARALATHQLEVLDRRAHRRRRHKQHEAAQLDARLKSRSTPRQRRREDEDEGRALARSRILLPGDQLRTRRPPSLERQEAFRDARTSRKRTLSGSTELDSSDEAELYRIGLLYDDEHERGSGFNFGFLTHDAPEFSVRPAKRDRKRRTMIAQDAPGLSLHLSFSALGDDKALAPFLFPIPSVEGPAQDVPLRTADRKFASQPALTTIYEFEHEDVAPFLSEPNTQSRISLATTSQHLNTCLNYDLDMELAEDEDAWAFLDSPVQSEIKEEKSGMGSATEDDAWSVLDDDL